MTPKIKVGVMRMNRKYLLLTGGALAIVLAAAVLLTGSPAFEPPEQEKGHLSDDAFYTLVTPEGNRVTESTLDLGVGDEYIDGDNRLWRVVRVEGDRITVEDQGLVDMPDVSQALQSTTQDESHRARTGFLSTLSSWVGWSARAGGERGTIGIYHTHNAESYVPSSGDAFDEDYGDIHEVGQKLAETFENMGHRVIWREDSHLPHDGGAYLRSRRTAAEISREKPITILDVHRDAIPRKEEYLAEVDGETMSQVRLVVGRQNQNREVNLEYAKQIKAIADEKYPGLIKGIFHARGNYNQDLGPRMILLEFGTHVTSLEQALQSVEPAAEVIVAAVGLSTGTGSRQMGAAGSNTVLWILVLGGLGAAGWMVLNKEGWGRLRESVATNISRLTNRKNRGDDS